MKTKITLLVLTALLGLTNVFANSMPGTENIVENEIMTTGDNSIIISAGKRIYTLDMNTYQATLLTTSPYVNEINSIASSNATGWIFYVSNHISRYNWTIYGYNVYTDTHKNFGSVRHFFTSTGHAYSSRGLASGGATFYNGKLYFAMEYPTYCYYGRGETSGNDNPKDELSNNVRTAGTVSNTMFTNGPITARNSSTETDEVDTGGRTGTGETPDDFQDVDAEEANAPSELVSDYIPEEDLPANDTADDALEQRGTSNAESYSYSYHTSRYNNRMYLLEISFSGLSDASGSTTSVSNGRPVYDNWGYSSFLYRGELGDIVVDDNGQLYAATSYQVQAYNFNSNRYDWANNEDVYAQMAKDKHSALQLLKNKRQCSTTYYYGCPHTTCTTKSFVQKYTAPSHLRTYNSINLGGLNEITGLDSNDVGKITDASDYVRLTPPVSYKIEGFVFDDNNENGNFNSGQGETKLDGVAVTLYADTNTDGVLDAGDTVIETQNTNASGNYTFNNVDVANTLVKVGVPTNDASFTYTLTTAEVVAVTGATADITGIKFGINKQPVVVNVAYDVFGTVYDDDNENAALEGTEAGLANVTLTLYADTNADGILDAGDTVITTTTSGTDGSYSFLHVCIQNTIVAVTVPTATGNFTYTLTTPGTQAIDSIDTNVTGVDFGINESQVINFNVSGTVFDDDNANGTLETGEETLEAVTVSLYADNNFDGTLDAGDTFISSTSTIVTGAYNFSAITVQDVIVTVTVPTDTGDFTFTLTTAGALSASSTTTDVTGLDFGINKVQIIDYSVSGNVYDDNDESGAQDAGEDNLESVTVTLYADNNANGVVDAGDVAIASAPSAVDGTYNFLSITVENTVTEVTVPANTANFTYTLTTLGEQNTSSINTDIVGINFGINRVQVIDFNISGTVFDDDNGNGAIDATETGRLDNVTMMLYADTNEDGALDAGDTMITSTTTGVDGAYAFSNVTTEKTLVMVSVPTNTPNFTYNSTSPELLAATSTIADVTGLDFGVDQVQVIDYNISGTVFDDDNTNGTNDTEAGLDAITVKLYSDNDASGTLTAGDGLLEIGFTGVDGTYSFTNVTTEFTLVGVEVPANTPEFTYTATTAVKLGVSSTINDVTNQDFGINRVQIIDFNISGTVFDDDNGNGAIDATETGRLDNVTMMLYADTNEDGALDAGDTMITSTTTGVDGAYAFSNVTTEKTLVMVSVPTNTPNFTYNSTSPELLAATSTIADVTGLDFGVDQVQVIDYNISGTVFDDDNTNGTNDTEAGLDAITVKLYSDNDASGTLTAGDGLLEIGFTGVDGTYSFTNVTTEFTLVGVEVPANTPEFTYTATTAVKLGVSSTINDVTNQDFGINRVQIIDYNISGTVFDDNNDNGLQDAGDGVLDGINITLYADNNNDGNLDVADTTLTTTTTGVNGAYSFSNITTPNVLAVITVPGNTATFVYALTTSNTQAASSTITDVTGLDFGVNETEVINYNISGNVFDDNDASGVREMGEGFIGGALITLYADTNNDGVLDAGDTVITTTTTSTMSGNYNFTGVTVKNTLVVVSVPGNTASFTYALTTSGEQAVSSTITNVANVNFGIDRVQVINYNISGTVYDDDNENGALDTAEAGRLDNVTLTLYADNDNNGRVGAGDTIITTTTSATDGTFGFSAVTTRNTLVVVSVPANDSTYNYALTTSERSVTSSTINDVTNVNFGINKTTASYTVSGNVFNDTNGDGDNTADAGLTNVTVRLYDDANGNGRIDRGESLLATTTSDRSGNYSFPGLTTVNVVVQVLVPSNTAQFLYVATTPVNVPLSSGVNTTVNFGITRTLVVLYNVSGVVWDDDNTDQVIDANELRLEGISITLYEDINGDGVIDATDPALSTIATSVTGTYQFTGVNVRNVIVSPTLPSNGTYTTQGLRAISSVNTDVANVNFGIDIAANLFQVTGVVFDDDNQNGVADPGEGSVDGLSVEIYVDTDSSGTFDPNLDALVAFTQTSNGGFGFLDPNYLVNDVPSGLVFVVIGIPAPTQFISYTPTYDPDSGTVNPDGVFPTIMTGSIAGINFGIDFVDLNATSRVSNGDDVMFTNGNAIDAAPEDVSERLRLYPNPAVNQIAINAEEFAGDVTVEIYNDRGYKVMTTTVSQFGNEARVNVQRLAPGMYYAKFTSIDAVAKKKFIKR